MVTQYDFIHKRKATMLDSIWHSYPPPLLGIPIPILPKAMMKARRGTERAIFGFIEMRGGVL